MKCIAIIGPPGCGKGTQAALLTQRGFAHISTGEILRKERDRGTTLGRIINRYLREGAYVPDEIVTEMLSETLSAASAFPDKVILDGYPRTVNQLKLLEEMFIGFGIQYDLTVIHLKVQRDELLRRMIARGRKDDEGLLDERLEVYSDQTGPVIQSLRFNGKYPIFDVDGNRPIAEIAEDIQSHVETVLTADALLAIEEGAIFATGLTTDDAQGCNMTSSGKQLRWIAKRGYGDDWAIYVHWADRSIEWIAESGDKVSTRGNVNKLVPCTDEAYKLYRR